MKKNYYIKIIKTNGIKTGPGNARNIGIKKAKGEFIGYLDADDEERNKKFNDLVLKEAAKIFIDQIEFNADQGTNLLTVNSN